MTRGLSCAALGSPTSFLRWPDSGPFSHLTVRNWPPSVPPEKEVVRLFAVQRSSAPPRGHISQQPTEWLPDFELPGDKRSGFLPRALVFIPSEQCSFGLNNVHTWGWIAAWGYRFVDQVVGEADVKPL